MARCGIASAVHSHTSMDGITLLFTQQKTKRINPVKNLLLHTLGSAVSVCCASTRNACVGAATLQSLRLTCCIVPRGLMLMEGYCCCCCCCYLRRYCRSRSCRHCRWHKFLCTASRNFVCCCRATAYRVPVLLYSSSSLLIHTLSRWLPSSSVSPPAPLPPPSCPHSAIVRLRSVSSASWGEEGVSRRQKTMGELALLPLW